MIVYQTVITDNREKIVCKGVSGDFAPPCFKGQKIITASQITVSQFYYEAYFKDYTVDMSYYNYENNVSSRWVTETDNYRISGNVVTIYDNQNAIDFIYNPQNRTMYMRIASETAEYGLMTIFIYFRK